MTVARLPRSPVATTITNEHCPGDKDANRALKAPERLATTDFAARGPPRTIARTRTPSPALKRSPRTSNGERSRITSRGFEPDSAGAGSEGARPATTRISSAANERTGLIIARDLCCQT